MFGLEEKNIKKNVILARVFTIIFYSLIAVAGIAGGVLFIVDAFGLGKSYPLTGLIIIGVGLLISLFPMIANLTTLNAVAAVARGARNIEESIQDGSIKVAEAPAAKEAADATSAEADSSAARVAASSSNNGESNKTQEAKADSKAEAPAATEKKDEAPKAKAQTKTADKSDAASVAKRLKLDVSGIDPAKLDRLDRAFASGTITEEQYRHKVAQYKKEVGKK